MRSRSSKLRAALLVLLLAAPASAFAVDNARTTLESDLAGDIVLDLIKTFDAATAAPAGFESFEALYLAFETERKWQAYLDAIKAANLPTDGAPLAELTAAIGTLEAHGIDRVSIATMAIEKLAGVADWQAADQAQSELVIKQLAVLVTEIVDPGLRVTGQLLLARVELNTNVPQAAQTRVAAALTDLASIADADTQLGFARELADIIFTLNDPHTIEIVSEIVASIADPLHRSTLTDEIALRLKASSARVAVAAAVDDPLALAWRYQIERLAGGGDLNTAIAGLAGNIDPLPIAILLASGAASAERQLVCENAVTQLIAEGASLRALNLRKMLPAGDCSPRVGLLIGEALARGRMDGAAISLLATYLASAGTQPSPDDLQLLDGALFELGAVDLIDAHRASLVAWLGEPAFNALAGRAAINALLHAHPTDGETPAAIAAAASLYPPSAAMLALIEGDAVPMGAEFTEADRSLLVTIGSTLGASPKALPGAADFLDGDALLALRLALAQGITSRLDFNTGRDPRLTEVLRALSSETADPLLSASLVDIPGADLTTDEMLVRAARRAAWSGDVAAADALALRATDAASLALEIASIGAVVGDFQSFVDRLTDADLAIPRTRSLRFVAEQRLGELDINGWFTGIVPAPTEPLAEIVKASAMLPGKGFAANGLTIDLQAPGAAPAAPALPDLTVDSADVTSIMPLPTGGQGGLVVGGEGRFVRLARFESPSFDGERNNGVRDYVYQQNKTITPEFIFLNSGVFTLADVVAAIGRQKTDAIELLPDGVVRINRPVAIGADATLILSGAEVREVQLNATLGAYLVNAGQLFIADTRIVGFDVVANAPAYVGKTDNSDKFRPFILSWSGSKTFASDTEFVAMGYSAGRSYGLSMTSGPDDDFYRRSSAPSPTGIIVNNSFDNLYYGYYAYEAEHAAVVGNEYRNSVVYGIDPHDRSRHLNLSLNAAYGSFKKHGIIISREVDDSFIVGNLSFGNHGSGIMLDRDSVGTIILGNTLRANDGDGMAVFESPCTLIAMNDISLNGRSGVLVRNSWDVTVADNQIFGNKGAGVQGFISDLAVSDGSAGRNFVADPYEPFTTLSIRQNAIEANGAGIQTAGVSLAEIYGNRFRHQSHALFGGDLAELSPALMQASSRSIARVVPDCQPVRASHQCVLTLPGADLSELAATTAPRAPDYCVDSAGTVQAQAFGGGAL